MTFRSLETRCKSPFSCFCFRFQCLIYVALADSRCISDGSTSVQEAFKATKAKSSCPIWRLRNFAGHWSGSFWKGLLMVGKVLIRSVSVLKLYRPWVCSSFDFYILNPFTYLVISNEFIRSFHQFVSRIFFHEFFSGWAVEKEAKHFIGHKQVFFSVCQLIRKSINFC